MDVNISGSSGKLRYTSISNEESTTLASLYGVRPTNTSVLYCIKYEPTYFMNNTYSADSVYSTDETVIGKWIDGKPLYRRTFSVTTPSEANTATNICSIGSDVGLVTNIEGMIEGIASNIYISLNFSTNTSVSNEIVKIATWIRDGYIRMTVQSDYVNKSGYVTVTYTKTTD